MQGDRSDRGQATPLVAAVVVLAGVLGLGVVRLGAAATERARARNAADAAALAGAVGGRSEAEALARANGARLVAYREVDGDAVVTVALGRSTALARARPRLAAGVTVVGGRALPVARTALPDSAWSAPHHDHPAADLPVPTGTIAVALAGGVARRVHDDDCGIGVSVEVSSRVRYVYCHGSAWLVADGAHVTAGRPLLRTGSTGASTGPHLHVGVFVDGGSVCPQPLLVALAAGRPGPAWEALPSTGCVG